jgi:DNA-binding FadR family transcriptional regulator
VIVDTIKNEIVTRRMRPGDKLPTERELIDRHNAARGTVREAMKSLESLGLVSRRRGKSGGARVSSMSSEHATQVLRCFFYFEGLSWSELYAVRHCLEPEMAAQALQNITREVHEALEETLRVCRDDRSTRQERRIAELRFHELIAEQCPNTLLRFLCLFIDALLRDFIDADDVLATDGGHFATCTLKAHEEILQALWRQDACAVRARMDAHIQEAGAIIAEQAKRRADQPLL